MECVMAVITGDEFDNTYGGTSESDTIFGGLGNDSLTNGGTLQLTICTAGMASIR
jgi:Ca2+-binding RTX toxin-like protein